MNFHLLRVVLNSGSLTELAFNTQEAAAAAAISVRDTGMAVDDHGHDLSVSTNEIAALVMMDFEKELAGQQVMTIAWMRANFEAQQQAAAPLQKGPGLIRAMPIPGNGILHG